MKLAEQTLFKSKGLYSILNYESGLEIPCCISFFQTDIIFFDQFKVPTIKFGKCFVEFIVPIALLIPSHFQRLVLITFIIITPDIRLAFC